MHNVCAAGHIFGRRISGGVGRNGIAFSFFCGCITACGFQVDLKFSTGFIGGRAVKNLILLMNLYFSFDNLLFYCYLDFIVFQTVVSGFCPYRIYGTVNQISVGRRNFANRPIIAADVLLRRELPVGICGVLIDQVIAAVHAVHRARERGVALYSSSFRIHLCDGCFPLLEHVREAYRCCFIGFDGDRLSLWLYVLIGHIKLGHRVAAGLQVWNGNRSIGLSCNRCINSIAHHTESYARNLAVLRGLDDL